MIHLPYWRLDKQSHIATHRITPCTVCRFSNAGESISVQSDPRICSCQPQFPSVRGFRGFSTSVLAFVAMPGFRVALLVPMSDALRLHPSQSEQGRAVRRKGSTSLTRHHRRWHRGTRGWQHQGRPGRRGRPWPGRWWRRWDWSIWIW